MAELNTRELVTMEDFERAGLLVRHPAPNAAPAMVPSPTVRMLIRADGKVMLAGNG